MFHFNYRKFIAYRIDYQLFSGHDCSDIIKRLLSINKFSTGISSISNNILKIQFFGLLIAITAILSALVVLYFYYKYADKDKDKEIEKYLISFGLGMLVSLLFAPTLL